MHTYYIGLRTDNAFMSDFPRENRYVLFLTENYAALDILKNPKNYLSLSDELNVAQSTGDVAANDIQPFILFGSSFPKDKEYTQVSTCTCQVIFVGEYFSTQVFIFSRIITVI